MNSLDMKQCNKCNVIKLKELFYKSKHGKEGLDTFCKVCRVKKEDYYKNKIKKTIFDHYGDKCNCCGINILEFLVIDHINGDGNKHRRLIGQSGGYRFYQWIIRNNFPSFLQTLCYNCNNARGLYGYCPHEKERNQCPPL